MESQRPAVAEARAALEAVGAGRRRAARLLATPRWYHPVLGVLAGGLLGVQSIHSWPASAAAFGVYAAGVALLVGAYRRRTGVWVSGFRRGRAGRVTVVLVLLVELLVFVSLALEFLAGLRGACAVAGAVVAALVVLAGRRFDLALRAGLEE